MESAELWRKRLRSFSCMLSHLHAEIIACFLFVLRYGSTLCAVRLYIMPGGFICLSHLPADGTQVNDYCLLSMLQKTLLFKQEVHPASTTFTTPPAMSYAPSAQHSINAFNWAQNPIYTFYFYFRNSCWLIHPLQIIFDFH